MKKLMYVEGSPRKKRSHSINIANEYLDKVRENDRSNEIKTIDLWSLNLPEFTGDMMDAKYAVIGGADPSDKQKEAWGKVTKIFNDIFLSLSIKHHYEFYTHVFIYLNQSFRIVCAR